MKTYRLVLISLLTFCVSLSHVLAQSNLSEIIFVAFDVETTGFSPTQDRIIEIGAVKFKNGKIIDSAAWLINPDRPIKNAFIHGITDQMVAQQPRFNQIFPAFAAFTTNCILIAHNAHFDTRFISAELERHKMSPPPTRTLNTLPLFRHWFPDAPSHTLETLSEYLELQPAEPHRAASDAKQLQRIMIGGLKKHPQSTLPQLEKIAKGYLHFTENKK